MSTRLQDSGPVVRLGPSEPRPLRIAVLSSATGANLRTLLHLTTTEPELGEVVLVASDRREPASARYAREAGIPFVPGDFDARCGRWSRCRTEAERVAYRARAEEFHDDLGERLLAWEEESGRIDLIVLAYHRWIHGSFLRTFASRIVNQHPGDLAAREGGRRLLAGLDPVGAAGRLGLRSTRTSCFLVDDSHDGGPVLARGPEVPFPVADRTSASGAEAQERRQKRLSDPGALAWTVRAFGAGRLSLDLRRRHDDGLPTVLLDGQPLAYGGHEAPGYDVPVGSSGGDDA